MEQLKGTRMMERYQSDGVPMTMMPDHVVIAGPSWLDFGLEYTEIVELGEIKEIQEKRIFKLYFMNENSKIDNFGTCTTVRTVHMP